MNRYDTYEDYMRDQRLGRFRDSYDSRYSASRDDDSVTLGKILLIALAILLPPDAVLIRRGLSWDLLLNIVLTMIGYLPGQVHAVWIAFRNRR